RHFARPPSFPRRVAAARVLLSAPAPPLLDASASMSALNPCRCEPTPNRGAGGAPRDSILISIALVRRDPTVARRSRPGANRNGRLGAPPWRFLGPLPALGPELPPARSRGHPRRPGVAPGGAEVPNLPSRGYGRTPGRHTSLRLRDRLRRRPS